MTDFNTWFCGLPEGRQAVLRDDKWMLAQAAFDAAVAAEREACAKLAESTHPDDCGFIASAIRARSEQT